MKLDICGFSSLAALLSSPLRESKAIFKQLLCALLWSNCCRWKAAELHFSVLDRGIEKPPGNWVSSCVSVKFIVCRRRPELTSAPTGFFSHDNWADGNGKQHWAFTGTGFYIQGSARHCWHCALIPHNCARCFVAQCLHTAFSSCIHKFILLSFFPSLFPAFPPFWPPPPFPTLPPSSFSSLDCISFLQFCVGTQDFTSCNVSVWGVTEWSGENFQSW